MEAAVCAAAARIARQARLDELAVICGRLEEVHDLSHGQPLSWEEIVREFEVRVAEVETGGG